MFVTKYLTAFVLIAFSHERLANGDKDWAPMSSSAYQKQQPDLTKMMERLLAGNDAMMRQLEDLERQQREQKLQLERVNRNQEEERQRRIESTSEQQYLRQLVSNLTSELTTTTMAAEGDAAVNSQRTVNQLELRRAKRDLQVLACNVTAELQTVISASEAASSRIQQLESQNSQLRREVQGLNEAVAELERRLVANITFAVAQLLGHQHARELQRHETLVTRVASELRNAKTAIVAAVRTSGGNETGAAQQTPSCEPSDDAVVGLPPTTRRPRERSNQSRRLTSAELTSTIRTGNCAWAVSQFGNKLYVGRSQQSYIEIYDVETLTHQRNLSTPGLGCINDAATCPECDVIYLLDHCRLQMYVVDEHGIRAQWAVGDAEDKPVSVSVTFDSNVLVTFENSSRVAEYSADGSLVRTMTLQPDLGIPTHAVQLAENRYVVGQGIPGKQGLHRVCTIDEEGRMLRCFGAERGSGVSRLNAPARLAVVNGTVLVVDALNDRVIMLNGQSLTYVREVLSEPTPAEVFVRLSIADDYSRLYVAHNEFAGGKCQSGKVKVYRLTWIG